MKEFYVFVTGAVIFFITGLVGSLVADKAWLLLWLCDCRFTFTDYFFYYVTTLGEEHGFIFFGILLWLSSWRRMLTIPITGIIVSVVSYVLKQIFEHERPLLYLNQINWEGPREVLGYHLITGTTSFPSGHSMAAWALFTLVAAHFRKSWFSVIALFFAISVSISRIYLVVHFLQDVVAGGMIGFVLGYLVYYYYRKWTLQRPDPEFTTWRSLLPHKVHHAGKAIP